jgi:hypothetical protein
MFEKSVSSIYFLFQDFEDLDAAKKAAGQASPAGSQPGSHDGWGLCTLRNRWLQMENYYLWLVVLLTNFDSRRHRSWGQAWGSKDKLGPRIPLLRRSTAVRWSGWKNLRRIAKQRPTGAACCAGSPL